MILDLYLCFTEMATRSCNDSRCGDSDEQIISCKVAMCENMAIPFKIRCCTYFFMFHQGYISPPPQIINPLFAYFCSSCWIFLMNIWLSKSDNDAKAQQAAHLSSKSVKSHVHISSIYNQGIHVASKLGLDHVFFMGCWTLSNKKEKKHPYCRTGLCSSK